MRVWPPKWSCVCHVGQARCAAGRGGGPGAEAHRWVKSRWGGTAVAVTVRLVGSHSRSAWNARRTDSGAHHTSRTSHLRARGGGWKAQCAEPPFFDWLGFVPKELSNQGEMLDIS